MSFTINSYNYATPPSSTPGLISGNDLVADLRYFTLADNALDGSYVPISGDVGMWGNSLSDADGVLAEPFILTVTESLSINAFRLVGSQYSYPVAFTVSFYAEGTLLYTIEETANAVVEYVMHLTEPLEVTSYTITITKISQPNAVARLYRAGSVGHVLGVDSASVRITESVRVSTLQILQRKDTVRLETIDATHIHNTMTAEDTLNVHGADIPVLTNVHTRMKDPFRRVYGKVYVTYTDPMLESETSIEASSTAYNSMTEQVLDGTNTSDDLFFTLYDNDLSGRYRVMSEGSQTGWVSGVASDAIGIFAEAPTLSISFFSRPVTPLTIYFDDSHGSVPVDFDVEFHRSTGDVFVKSVRGNSESAVLITDDTVADVHTITIRVFSNSKPNSPVSILEVPVMSTLLYTGYADRSDLVSIDLLEELTYDDTIEALGGISANEVSVVFDNSDRAFYFNNAQSVVASQLKRNRKVVPWLGVEIVPGNIEWYKLGVFWSYSWTVPVNGLTATVVAFDTLRLLDTTTFEKHHTLVDKSLGELIEYVLSDAKASLDFLEWNIDPELYNVVIPYAWFASGSHTAALRRISQAYPMHVYCDREGVICAAPQRLHRDYYYDTWSDSTNVIGKEYSSLYTTLPNIVNVKVNIPQLVDSTELVSDNLVFDVADMPTRSLLFSKPYVSDITVSIDKDASVSYTYEAYSWGIVFTFTGSGQVRSISCIGTIVDTTNNSSITRRNEDSIRIDGAIKRDISAEFIQTASLASTIMNRIFDLAEYDKYDATVTYRGDIALSINDPIRLLDGIAPDNRYIIRRHQLNWNGALTGSADINT